MKKIMLVICLIVLSGCGTSYHCEFQSLWKKKDDTAQVDIGCNNKMTITFTPAMTEKIRLGGHYLESQPISIEGKAVRSLMGGSKTIFECFALDKARFCRPIKEKGNITLYFERHATFTCKEK